MNDQPESGRDPEASDRPPDGKHAKDAIYIYRDSGIRERHGKIPMWLKIVTLVLVLWSIYYTVVYWSPPVK